MKIIDIPIKYNDVHYRDAINKQVKYFSKIKNVKNVYQIGGVSTPGISDIDLILVFKDGSSFNKNPRIINNEIANYLFTHNLYGVQECDFRDSLKYTFFHNHKLLHGNELQLNNDLTHQDQKILKTQIAIEFLIKMYINLTVQKSYKIIKLRSLFLHVKALIYDFEFLDINPEPLKTLVYQGINYRNSWFDGNVTPNDIKQWFNTFFIEFESFLNTLLKDYNFYSSENNFKVGPNITIRDFDKVEYNKIGIVFPDIFNLNKKHVKLLNRFNYFDFKANMNLKVPEIIEEYFNYVERINCYNNLYLPHFMPLTSSLRMYNK